LEKIEVKKIDSTSAQFLSSLAKSIYVPHYAHLWLPGGMDWYINEFAYPVLKIKSEIENESKRQNVKTNVYFICLIVLVRG